MKAAELKKLKKVTNDFLKIQTGAKEDPFDFYLREQAIKALEIMYNRGFNNREVRKSNEKKAKKK